MADQQNISIEDNTHMDVDLPHLFTDNDPNANLTGDVVSSGNLSNVPTVVDTIKEGSELASLFHTAVRSHEITHFLICSNANNDILMHKYRQPDKNASE